MGTEGTPPALDYGTSSREIPRFAPWAAVAGSIALAWPVIGNFGYLPWVISQAGRYGIYGIWAAEFVSAITIVSIIAVLMVLARRVLIGVVWAVVTTMSICAVFFLLLLLAIANTGPSMLLPPLGGPPQLFTLAMDLMADAILGTATWLTFRALAPAGSGGAAPVSQRRACRGFVDAFLLTGGIGGVAMLVGRHVTRIAEAYLYRSQGTAMYAEKVRQHLDSLYSTPAEGRWIMLMALAAGATAFGISLLRGEGKVGIKMRWIIWRVAVIYALIILMRVGLPVMALLRGE
jgi:hypothetical protein